MNLFNGVLLGWVVGLDGRQEYVRFLNIAQGSAAETEYLLILARDLEYLSPATFERLASELDEVARMLHGLRVKVEAGT